MVESLAPKFTWRVSFSFCRHDRDFHLFSCLTQNRDLSYAQCGLNLAGVFVVNDRDSLIPVPVTPKNG